MADDNQRPQYRVAPPDVEERFQSKMTEIELREQERATRELATQGGLGYIDLTGFPIGPETLTLFSEERARQLRAIPFLRAGGELRIAAIDPATPGLADAVAQLAQREHVHAAIYQITQHSLNQALKQYARLPKIKPIVSGLTITQTDIERYRSDLKDFWSLDAKLREASLTEVFAMVVAGAIEAKASDIHIEAEEQDVKVRYRIDGVLQTVAAVSKSAWPRIISRIKLLAGLKLNIDTIPQDGRVTLLLQNDRIDVRVSTLPTSYGESVVMRLLRASSQGLKFEDLGVRGVAAEQLHKEIRRPNGMVITTGPTGSGKTTTLYAFMNELNRPDTKIITLEDPVEYRLAGINQSQVDAAKGYTYAKGLRAVLRQDPDIIMVGEIRDPEAGEIAIQASLTGHLVFSTLHTNDAAGAIPRFLAMGLKPFLLAPALNVVIGQRLVRRLCESCKKVDSPPAETLGRVQALLGALPKAASALLPRDGQLRFWTAEGCATCNRIGYRGRMGIFEVLAVTPDIQKLILAGTPSENDIREAAAKAGMVTMAQDGLLKALEGITSVDEVFAVAE